MLMGLVERSPIFLKLFGHHLFLVAVLPLGVALDLLQPLRSLFAALGDGADVSQVNLAHLVPPQPIHRPPGDRMVGIFKVPVHLGGHPLLGLPQVMIATAPFLQPQFLASRTDHPPRILCPLPR
ncbi:hypothetical protein AMR42_13450 [Limnothrix sp. PR1529]|nr:hypothetical protein BCR12_08605 [Limnothrix sp. P13C2]PIB08483.1 hypothetical protein AMR42_13450 [Limnothrix sp. PR1529]